MLDISFNLQYNQFYAIISQTFLNLFYNQNHATKLATLIYKLFGKISLGDNYELHAF